ADNIRSVPAPAARRAVPGSFSWPVPGGGAVLQGLSRFGLEQAEDVADPDVAVEFLVFLGGERPFSGLGSKFIHALPVGGAEVERQESPSGLWGKIRRPRPDEPAPDRGFGGGRRGSLRRHGRGLLRPSV